MDTHSHHSIISLPPSGPVSDNLFSFRGGEGLGELSPSSARTDRQAFLPNARISSEGQGSSVFLRHFPRGCTSHLSPQR